MVQSSSRRPAEAVFGDREMQLFVFFPLMDTLIMADLILYITPNTVNTNMSTKTPTTTVDAKGENCPMPVIKTKSGFDELAAGETVEVLATDSGSLSDIAGWAESTEGAALLDQEETTEDGQTVYRHCIEKVA